MKLNVQAILLVGRKVFKRKVILPVEPFVGLEVTGVYLEGSVITRVNCNLESGLVTVFLDGLGKDHKSLGHSDHDFEELIENGWTFNGHL